MAVHFPSPTFFFCVCVSLVLSCEAILKIVQLLRRQYKRSSFFFLCLWHCGMQSHCHCHSEKKITSKLNNATIWIYHGFYEMAFVRFVLTRDDVFFSRFVFISISQVLGSCVEKMKERIPNYKWPSIDLLERATPLPGWQGEGRVSWCSHPAGQDKRNASRGVRWGGGIDGYDSDNGQQFSMRKLREIGINFLGRHSQICFHTISLI